jgi:hypothetical protein
MPNWCGNTLTVRGTKEDIKKFKEKAATEKSDLTLDKLYPMSKKLVDWYDWCVKNWGTKWDVDGAIDTDTENELVYMFDSAWSPPINAFIKISKDFPDLSFTLEYEEPGMCFEGTAEFQDGDFSDDCREIQCGICSFCGDEVQILGGECSNCGKSLNSEDLIKKVGSILK